MQNKIFKKNNKKRLAISEIILLITSVLAFSFLVGQSLPLVSAAGECITSTTGTEVKISTIIDVSSWCEQNGRSSVCNGGSGSWTLREDKKHACANDGESSSLLVKVQGNY